MITASEALKLPSAQLTPTIKAKTEHWLAEIESQIRAGMEYHGCIATIRETDRNVIQHLVLQLKNYQWEVQISPIVEPSALSGQPSVTGYAFQLFPAESVYLESTRLVQSFGN